MHRQERAAGGNGAENRASWARPDKAVMQSKFARLQYSAAIGDARCAPKHENRKHSQRHIYKRLGMQQRSFFLVRTYQLEHLSTG